MAHVLTSLLVVACSHLVSSAPISYDVILVGSGPGGLVAAEHLTRQRDLSVLMLEAGERSLHATGGTDAPSYAASTAFTQFDIPGEFNNVIYNKVNERYRVDWLGDQPNMWLGKLVGGCSSINAALYFRTPDAYVQKALWPFPSEQVNAGFEAIEAFFHQTDVPSSDGKHYLNEAYEIVGNAFRAIGYANKTLNDQTAKNDKHQTFGRAPYAIHNGLRDSPAKTFYSVMKNRSNFALQTNAKVLLLNQTDGVVTSVVYERNGVKEAALLSARGVVLMAAGALSTPQILMQSGIGPQTQLEQLATKFDHLANKKQWVVNENVGRHVFDTNVVFATLRHADMKPFLFKKRPASAIQQYLKDQSGPWTIPGPVLIAYESFEVNGYEYDFQTTVLPHGFGDDYETANTYTMAFYVNNPQSRDFASFSSSGTYQVATNGSWYMSHPDDLKAMQLYATKMIQAAVDQGSEFLATEQDVAAYVKAKAGSVTHHFGGSCYTSSDANDPNRCADETFKVIGTKNVFVADASLMKEGTVNPYGFIMYIGHQAAKNVFAQAFGVNELPSSSHEGDATSDKNDAPSAAASIRFGWSLLFLSAMMLFV